MEHAQAEYAQLYYQHQAENLRINEDAFVWAKHQSVFIFVVAHVLLFVGIGAAYYEFRNAMKLRQKAWQQDEIKIELEGVALKTSLNAIWLLLGAFVFYFLYIKYVYTITVVG